ncbi:MAG: UTP--glucose-1-phosphate uridylyltransferase GalU [Gammaproteobacteria bacterium]|nr:UTP--glucose-1-phosphate uridylyltransferase GalU [Gammaproteobacteria bacterium]MDH5693599.1 UTP--glucose-1-phosphate uridylyltransferase GalU [Gammaproteobacteria bacterium]
MAKPVRKAVFPVAGMGTRFLPATKANPKEMLPVVDKPLIQYAAEEAVAAGCTQLIFVTSSSKRAIEDHFDKNFELETKLEQSNKQKLLEIVQGILPDGVSCVYVRQPEALGLGHAVLCAKDVVGDEPFCVILADDLIDGNGRDCLTQMVDCYDDFGSSVIGVEEVGQDETDKYGIVAVTEMQDRVARIDKIVEKPKPTEAPSNLAVVGRYVLTPRIFELLEKVGQGSGGEIQLTDAIAMLKEAERVLAYRFEGTRYDCGSKLGYLMATVEYGLKHEGLGEEFRSYIRSLAQSS